ncbi:MAG: SocA family protein [Candidatus Heimdallarchaeota archaeon]|nr:SocA family protein [Candidatus Heimdallarchaeota archaeon]
MSIQTEEWVTNHLLTLYLCKSGRKHNLVLSTRLQKAVFLSQLEMWKDKCQGFAFDFIKYHYGPFSSELRSSLEFLVKSNYLESGNKGFKLTPHGYNLLDKFIDIFTRNRHQTNHIKIITKNIMTDDFDQMLEEVYQLKNPLTPSLTIEETPLEMALLIRNEMAHGKRTFKFTDEEFEDLAMLFDPEFVDDMQVAQRSILEGNLTEWKPSKQT